MKARMDEAGLPYGKRSMTYNSRLSQELGAWADTQPDGQKLHDVLYRAYFVDNLNIGDVDTLVKLTEQAGFDEIAARRVLSERSFEAIVDENWRRAAEYGITGVPSFVSNQLCLVGCQPYETLMRFANHLRSLREEASH
jgi:predicted DsbA family dithiol-disulfide isomerase